MSYNRHTQVAVYVTVTKTYAADMPYCELVELAADSELEIPPVEDIATGRYQTLGEPKWAGPELPERVIGHGHEVDSSATEIVGLAVVGD